MEGEYMANEVSPLRRNSLLHAREKLNPCSQKVPAPTTSIYEVYYKSH